jgi:5-methylcytosine-specific restriction endonuclease McrA
MVTDKRRIQRIASTFNAKARRLHRPGVVSWEMLAVVGRVERSGPIMANCFYCGTELRLADGSWDHVKAFDKGGTNYITNIVRCCTTCQREKHTKSPDEYAEHQVRLVTCKRPGCTSPPYRPRWAEWQAGRARYCSHQCAGMAKGQAW